MEGHHLNKLWMAGVPDATYLVFWKSILWFRKRRCLKDVYHIWAWRPLWSCDQHHVNIYSFPCTQKLTYKIWLKMAHLFLRKANFKFPHFSIEKPKLHVWPCRKIGQGQPRVIIWTNYDGKESLMLHTKFGGNRPIGSREEDFWQVFTIYGRGSHANKLFPP